MKFSDIRDLKNDELQETLQTLRKNLFTIRLKSKIIEKKELYNSKPIKRDIARILTLISSNSSKQKNKLGARKNISNQHKKDDENISNSGE